MEVDQNGVSKGYGYVHFETQEEADQAVAKVNGMQMADKIVYVFFLILLPFPILPFLSCIPFFLPIPPPPPPLPSTFLLFAEEQ